MPLAKNQMIELSIEGVASDGNALGRHDGFVVFVPGAAVGDVLRVRVVKPGKSYAYGRIEQIMSPGPGRQTPDCPIAQTCGGCDFRHLTYQAELAAKETFVAAALRRLGGFDTLPLPIVAAPNQDRYRNKVQYPMAQNCNNNLMYGFYAKRSHRVVPCADCRLQPQGMNRLAACIARLLAEQGATAYNETTHMGLVRHITLRQGAATGEVLLCLVLNGNALPNNKLFVSGVLAEHPEVTTVLLNKNRDATNVIHGAQGEVLYGIGYIHENMSGVPLRLNEHTFSQVNSDAAEILFSIIRKFSAPDKAITLLDLYCGTGVIGLSMATACKSVIGVELVPQAVESARQSASEMGLANTRFICADAGEAAQSLAADGTHPTVVVLDPPRKGVSAEALDAVVQMGPSRIVMVSCNPATMARDAAYLATHGYRLDTVQPVDLFPRTRHVECVCLLSKY